MVRFGTPGKNIDPLSYADGRLAGVPSIQAPRRPTVNDKKFPMWCEWRVNKNASAPAAEGEFWKLVKFESNGDATWVRFGSGLLDLRDQVDTLVTPSSSGYIDVDGIAVANAANPSGIPLETVADVANNTLDVQIQVAADRNGAPGDKNDAGVASFNDTHFIVDADGYVSIIGGPPGASVISVTGDDAAVVGPDVLGNIDWQGEAVDNTTFAKPLYMDGTPASNLMKPKIQVAAHLTGAPGNKNRAGISSYNDTQFVVNIDGYVSLVGGANLPVVQTITGDDAQAVGPDANGNIDWKGEAVANTAFTKPLYMDGTPGSNLMNPKIQVARDVTGAPADKDDAGLSSYNDTQFVVNTDGYVSLIGNPIKPVIQTIVGDDGEVVGPDANGSIDWQGEVVGSKTFIKPLYMDGTPGSNLMNPKIQVSRHVTGAPGDKLDAGISSFNDTHFTVDTDGYVSIIAGVDIATITGDDAAAVSPDGAGNIDWHGSTIATGVNLKPLYMNGTPGSNLMEPEIQVTTTVIGAPADKNKAGIASFNSTHFTVTEHGYVSIIAGTDILTITGDDAEAVGPDGAGNIDWQGLAVAANVNAKPLHFNGSPGTNHMQPEIQVADAITGAPANKNKAGIATFSDADFTVDEHGYVELVSSPTPPAKFGLYEDFIVQPFSIDEEHNQWLYWTWRAALGVTSYDAGHPGILSLLGSTGDGGQVATCNLHVAAGSSLVSLPIASGEVHVASWAKAGAFAEAGEHSIFGFMNSSVKSYTPTKYAWLTADHGQTFWRAQNYDGTQTSTTTAVNIDTAWHYFEVIINAAGTSIVFKIDDATVATHTTNLPDVAIAAGWVHDRASSTAYLSVDTMELNLTLTGDRATTQ